MQFPSRLDKRAVAGKTKIRSSAHRAWVRSHRCCVPGCQLMPIECAHVSRAWSRGMGMKSSDGMTLSLCREHHAESHRGEKTFEKRHGVDLEALAREFYRRSPYRQRLDDPWAGRL